MFTGIIREIGTVTDVGTARTGKRYTIRAPKASRKLIRGASIALDGTCLTVTAKRGTSIRVDVVPETLRRTTLGLWRRGERVNVELPIRSGEAFDGHLVQGHVDTTGSIVTVLRKRTGERVLTVRTPRSFTRTLVPKGSIAVDGISLTISAVRGSVFQAAIIPETWRVTTLRTKARGDRVNLEADIALKYLDRLMRQR